MVCVTFAGPLSDLQLHGPKRFDTLWSALDVERNQTRCGLTLALSVSVQKLVQTALGTQCATKQPTDDSYGDTRTKLVNKVILELWSSSCVTKTFYTPFFLSKQYDF